MKNFVFVSDFDGTLTHQDFYQIVIDTYLKDDGRNLYQRWKSGEFYDVDFLNTIFSSMNRSENEILEDILAIPFDNTAVSLIRQIENKGNPFIILSAGTSYYISILLKHLGLDQIKVISNDGYYKDRGIHINTNAKGEFYSRRYGVDKYKVLRQLKDQYDYLIFAGDSEPDLNGAMIADLVFAKGKLIDMMGTNNKKCIPFQSFEEIHQYLITKGVI